MPELGKKHIATGVVGVPAAVVLFVFTYFVTKDAHVADVARGEQHCAALEARAKEIDAKANGNVPDWLYYKKVGELESEIKAMRDRITTLEAKRLVGDSMPTFPQAEENMLPPIFGTNQLTNTPVITWTFPGVPGETILNSQWIHDQLTRPKDAIPLGGGGWSVPN